MQKSIMVNARKLLTSEFQNGKWFMDTEAISESQNADPLLNNEIAARTINRESAIGNRQSSDAALREACQEFEGMLIGLILKQGLKPGSMDEEESKSSDALREFAIEQAARELGRAESFGISKLLYEQMRQSRSAE